MSDQRRNQRQPEHRPVRLIEPLHVPAEVWYDVVDGEQHVRITITGPQGRSMRHPLQCQDRDDTRHEPDREPSGSRERATRSVEAKGRHGAEDAERDRQRQQVRSNQQRDTCREPTAHAACLGPMHKSDDSGQPQCCGKYIAHGLDDLIEEDRTACQERGPRESHWRSADPPTDHPRQPHRPTAKQRHDEKR